MLNKLHKIAQAIHIIRLPSIAVGTVALVATITIIFTSKTHADDFFLIPSIVALLWAMSCYFFIVTFRELPEKPSRLLRFTARLKQNIRRGWYWVIGALFIATTVAAVAITYRLISIWLADYAG